MRVARRGVLVGGVVVVAVVLLIVLRSGGGGGGGSGVADAEAEALSFVPAASAVVAEFRVDPGAEQGKALRDLATTFPAARFGADAVRGAVGTLGLDADEDLPALLGGPVVAWGSPRAITSLRASIGALRLELPPVLKAGVSAVVVGKSEEKVKDALDGAVKAGRIAKRGSKYVLRGGGVIGVEGPDVVLAEDAAGVDAAIATHRGGGGLTRATFAARLGPLAKTPALIRAAVTSVRAIAAPKAAGVPWVDALRGGSLALSLEKPGLKLRVHLATDPTRVTDAQLPIAPGPQAPRPASGTRGIVAGVRDLSQTVTVLDAAKGDLDLPFLDPIKNALATLDSVKGPLKTFGRIDVDAALVDQLTGTTTITPEATPNTLSLRAEMKNGGPLRTALNRLAAVPDFALKLAKVDLNVKRSGESYIFTDKGKTIVKGAVLGNTLVVTNDLTAGLRAIADRRPEQARESGAFVLHADDQAVRTEIIRRFHLPALAGLVLGGFGDVNATARAERGGLDFTAALALNR